MSKIFVFNYRDKNLDKPTKDILHETWYYLYNEDFNNDLSNVDKIWFAIKTWKWTWNLQEIWDNLTKVKSKNSISLIELIQSSDIDFNLVKAFNYYYEFYHKSDISYNEFIREKRNYVKVDNITSYLKNDIKTHSIINF